MYECQDLYVAMRLELAFKKGCNVTDFRIVCDIKYHISAIQDDILMVLVSFKSVGMTSGFVGLR